MVWSSQKERHIWLLNAWYRRFQTVENDERAIVWTIVKRSDNDLSSE